MPHFDAGDVYVEDGKALHSSRCLSQSRHAIPPLCRQRHFSRRYVPSLLDSVVQMARLDFVASWHVQLSIVFGSNHKVLFGRGDVTEEVVRVGFAIHDVNAATSLKPFASRFDQLSPPFEFDRFPILLSVRIRDWIISAENGGDASYPEWCASLTRSGQRNVPIETLRDVLTGTFHPAQSLSPGLSTKAEARSVVNNQDLSGSFCSPRSLAKMGFEQQLELNPLVVQEPIQSLQFAVVRHDLRKTMPRCCGYRVRQLHRSTIQSAVPQLSPEKFRRNRPEIYAAHRQHRSHLDRSRKMCGIIRNAKTPKRQNDGDWGLRSATRHGCATSPRRPQAPTATLILPS